MDMSGSGLNWVERYWTIITYSIGAITLFTLSFFKLNKLDRAVFKNDGSFNFKTKEEVMIDQGHAKCPVHEHVIDMLSRINEIQLVNTEKHKQHIVDLKRGEERFREIQIELTLLGKGVAVLMDRSGGIWGNGNPDIYNNSFERAPVLGGGHPDGVHLYGSYVRIFNNTFTRFLNTESGTAVVYWEPDGGENMDKNNHQPSNFLFYNNVFLETGTPIAPSMGLSLALSDSRFTAVDEVHILNNSFTGAFACGLIMSWGNTTLDKSLVTNVNIMGNIFYNAAKVGASMMSLSRPASASIPVDFGSYGSGASIIVDYNAYYSDSTTSVGYLGTTYTYSNFLSVSRCQINGVKEYPALNSDLTLQSGSPCRYKIPTANAPTTLFTTDKLGITRPQGSAWDIGAYEFRSNTPMIGVYNVKGMSGYYNANGMVGIAPN